MVALVEGGAVEDAAARDLGHHRLRPLKVRGHRLLAEDGHPARRRDLDGLGMASVGGGDVERVWALRLEHLGEVLIGDRARRLGRGARLNARVRDADERAAHAREAGREVVPRHPAEARDAPTEGHHHRSGRSRRSRARTSDAASSDMTARSGTAPDRP